MKDTFTKALYEALNYNVQKLHASKVKPIANRYEVGVEFMGDFEFVEDVAQSTAYLFIQNGEKNANISVNFFAWLSDDKFKWDADTLDNDWDSEGHVLEDIFEEAGVDADEVEEIGMDLIKELLDEGLKEAIIKFIKSHEE